MDYENLTVSFLPKALAIFVKVSILVLSPRSILAIVDWGTLDIAANLRWDNPDCLRIVDTAIALSNFVVSL